jgi:hypothetical protein
MRDVLHNIQLAWCEALPVGILVDVSAPRESLTLYKSNGIQISAGSRKLSEGERQVYTRPSTAQVDTFIKTHAWICPYQVVNLDNTRMVYDAVIRLMNTFE